MKKSLLISILMITVTLFCSCTSEIKNIKKEEKQNYYTCQYKAKNRNFYLYLPENQDKSTVPLVVMLHGYGSSAQSFIRQTEFEKDAVSRGYAVLYISGVPIPTVKTSSTGWNYTYDKNGYKDIRFIVDLTKKIQKEHSLNKKAYVVGFSNGAFMATKLAVEYSNVYNGIVSVGGMMPDMVWNHRKKSYRHPAYFFQINGMKDDVTPMRLNDSAKYNPHPAMEDVINYFCDINRIKTEPAEVKVNEMVSVTQYENKVWWMLIKDYPHSWPSRRFTKINVNNYILDFFDAKTGE